MFTCRSQPGRLAVRASLLDLARIRYGLPGRVPHRRPRWHLVRLGSKAVQTTAWKPDRSRDYQDRSDDRHYRAGNSGRDSRGPYVYSTVTGRRPGGQKVIELGAAVRSIGRIVELHFALLLAQRYHKMPLKHRPMTVQAR